MDTTARRARNEVVFRDANEEIKDVRQELSSVDGRTPFLCECEDARCREVLRLSLAEYEGVRSSPTRFVVAEGHPYGEATVVAEGRGWVVVEKHGEAARIAEENDPR